LFFRKANSIFKKAISKIAENISSHPGIYISCFLLIIAIAFYLPSLSKEEKQRDVLSSLAVEKSNLEEAIDSLSKEKDKLKSNIDVYGEEAEFWREKADGLENYIVEENENE